MASEAKPGKPAARKAAAAVASTSANGDGSRFNATDEKALEAIVDALTAARDGDFTVKLPARRRDVIGDVQTRVNELVARNLQMTREIQRLARVVGRDGRMTERAAVPGAYGGWADKVEAVNSLVDDLVRPTTEVGRVIAAVAQGDLSQKMALTIEGQPVKGEFSRIGQTVNAMVDQLGSFADEVTRVAREVGTDGKLGGQAEVKGVSGTWRDLTDSVNVMAANLTEQVRQIAQVTTAVANGDLTQQVTVDARGEVLELKRTINAMVARLSSFGDEVTRVAREVGTDGELGGQAQVSDVSGTWKDLTESVNVMASNLTDQVRQIAQVTTAVANGDLTQKVTVEAKGEVAALAATINDMTDTLRTFASEVTGVAREVGTEGVLGGQAEVPSAAGTWRDLTDSVNVMAANLTDQVRQIAQVTTAVASGDLTQKVTVEAKGEVAALAETMNDMTDTLRTFAQQVTGVAREVGTLGVLGGQADVPGVAGTWKDLTESVNSMATNLTNQVRNIAEVTTAVANGDLSPPDHGRRAGRDPRAQADDQHDGRPALLLRGRGHARRARGRHRGHPGRPGRGAGRLRHVARADGERQPARGQPDQPGPQHRAGHDRRGPGRPVAEDHRGCPGRDPRAQEHDQHDGRPALLASRTRSRAWRARSAPRASSAARPASKASPARGAGSPTT